jgi:hypothetical protein
MFRFSEINCWRSVDIAGELCRRRKVWRLVSAATSRPGAVAECARRKLPSPVVGVGRGWRRWRLPRPGPWSPRRPCLLLSEVALVLQTGRIAEQCPPYVSGEGGDPQGRTRKNICGYILDANRANVRTTTEKWTRTPPVHMARSGLFYRCRVRDNTRSRHPHMEFPPDFCN